jgi:hypothetical protein
MKKTMKKKTVAKKQVKTQQKKVENKVDELYVNFVLDETGSMSICREATISGFNEYIKTIEQKAKNVILSLTKFNSSKIETVFTKKIKDVPMLTTDTYIPNDMTPLYDAIAKTIKDTEKEAKGKSVLCVIMSDGEENSSKEYTREKVFALIKEKEKDKWAFVYLGANQDSYAIGQAIGLSKGNVINFATANIKATMGYAANTVAMYASMPLGDRLINCSSVLKDKDKSEKELTQ